MGVLAIVRGFRSVIRRAHRARGSKNVRGQLTLECLGDRSTPSGVSAIYGPRLFVDPAGLGPLARHPQRQYSISTLVDTPPLPGGVARTPGACASSYQTGGGHDGWQTPPGTFNTVPEAGTPGGPMAGWDLKANKPI